ncbi:fasciclin domain-containing protein [Psychrobacter sp. NG25]|nr:fasciclin domain-containing protein [Psychrobacter sp. NG25]
MTSVHLIKSIRFIKVIRIFNIIVGDIQVNNGVVHVIDTVLLPK